MTEIDVALTDYLICLLCLVFYVKLQRADFKDRSLKSLWLLFFISLAVASLFGGTVHGFFLDTQTLGYRVLWPVTLLSIGLTTFCAWSIGGGLFAKAGRGHYWQIFAGMQLAAYSFLVLFYSYEFDLVVWNYLPAMLFLLVVSLWKWRKERSESYAWLFLGVVLTLAAAGIQQLGIALNGKHFNHNSTYHLVQAYGLWAFFKAALKMLPLKIR